MDQKVVDFLKKRVVMTVKNGGLISISELKRPLVRASKEIRDGLIEELFGEGILDYELRPSASGPPAKMYFLTDKGLEVWQDWLDRGLVFEKGGEDEKHG